MPLCTFLHNLLNVLVQIANKMRLQKRNSVRGLVDLRAIVRLEGLGKVKNPVRSLKMEPVTFRLVA
jgi:hypothetical protein